MPTSLNLPDVLKRFRAASDEEDGSFFEESPDDVTGGFLKRSTNELGSELAGVGADEELLFPKKSNNSSAVDFSLKKVFQSYLKTQVLFNCIWTRF